MWKVCKDEMGLNIQIMYNIDLTENQNGLWTHFVVNKT